MHTPEDCPAFLISFLLLCLPYHLVENALKNDGKGKGELFREDLKTLQGLGIFLLLSVQQIISTDEPRLPAYIFTQCPGFTLLLHSNTEHSTPRRGLFTRAVAWSLPSRFFVAMLLLPYLAFSLTTFPSAAPLPLMPQHRVHLHPPHSPHLQGHFVFSHIS